MYLFPKITIQANFYMYSYFTSSLIKIGDDGSLFQYCCFLIKFTVYDKLWLIAQLIHSKDKIIVFLFLIRNSVLEFLNNLWGLGTE